MKANYLTCIGVLISLNVQAQVDLATISAQKLSGEIKFDGRVDDDAWKSISPLALTMHWPSFAGSLTEQTEIRLAYDQQYIYLSAINRDTEPDKIQEVSFQRDAISEQADHVVLMLDAYNDNENAQVFTVNATGSRADFTMKNDAQGGDAWNLSWNSYWDAEVVKTEDGWEAEIRVPFSSLRFQENNGKVEMGVGAYRYIARKRELQIYPAIPPDWGFWSFAKPSMFKTMEFEGIKNSRPWYTSPYVLGGEGHHYEYDDDNNPEKITNNDFQIGLDIQHAFSDNLNADFTLNTDFAQVEADDQTVNLSRFSLFFPEKRRFFLERSSTFDFKADGNNNMFYSRRIGISNGALVPMLGGVRLVGRVNSWDVGFINLQSRGIKNIASENFGVLRLRRNVFNPRSYVGGMVTSRINTEGDENYAYGFDGIINVFGEDFLRVNLAQSQDSEDSANLDPLDRARVYVQWQNRQSLGFGYTFSYSNVGSDYNPGLGFERRFDFNEFSGELGYLYFLPDEASLRTLEYSLTGTTSIGNSSGTMETRQINNRLVLNWDRGNSLGLNARYLIDRVPKAFRLSDEIEIAAVEYENTEFSIDYSTAAVGLLLSNFNVTIGKFYGGDMYSATIAPEVVASKFFQFTAFYQYSNINFVDLDQTFESHLARVKASVTFNVKWSIATIAQLNSLSEITAINMRLRYNPVDGNDLYLVYNEGINNNPTAVTPNLPISESRTIMMKYVHTFKF
jgi:hypothetical protein